MHSCPHDLTALLDLTWLTVFMYSDIAHTCVTVRSCPSIAHKQPPTTYLIARMHIEGYILCVESYWCLFILHFQLCRLYAVRSTQYVIIRTRIYLSIQHSQVIIRTHKIIQHSTAF